jgi:ABC-type multidrug transport system fused ATPase/permease subunit
VLFVANFFQQALLAYSGERLTFRLRRLFFEGLLRQEMAWFDDQRHSAGVLATKLASDIVLIEGITGQRLGMLAQLLGTVLGGLTIAFFSIWQLALVILACVPLIAVGGVLRMRLMLGFNQAARKAYEASGHVAAEATENVRTVAMLGREEAFLGDYRAALAKPDRASERNAHLGGATFALSESLAFFIMALAWWYGAQLVAAGTADFASMMRVIYAIVFAAMTIGQSAAMAGDWSRAVSAAAELFYILDRTPPIDVRAETGQQLPRIQGHLQFDQLAFTYPQRPTVPVLRGLSLAVPAGQTVALVGHSGCGKSTTLQLLQRFYDPASGDVTVDGVSVRALHLRWLRSQIGLVSQEPVLFATTIRDNILYGKVHSIMPCAMSASLTALPRTGGRSAMPPRMRW